MTFPLGYVTTAVAIFILNALVLWSVFLRVHRERDQERLRQIDALKTKLALEGHRAFKAERALHHPSPSIELQTYRGSTEAMDRLLQIEDELDELRDLIERFDFDPVKVSILTKERRRLLRAKDLVASGIAPKEFLDTAREIGGIRPDLLHKLEEEAKDFLDAAREFGSIHPGLLRQLEEENPQILTPREWGVPSSPRLLREIEREAEET